MTIKDCKTGDIIEHDLAFELTLADAQPGFVAGIASTPSIDHYGHKVLAGAFDQSINQKGLSGPRGIKLLVGHDWHKIAGRINKMHTFNDKLHMEAQLNLNVSYVKDLYEIIKQNEGLSFSVGFRLQDFEFAEDEDTKEDILVIKRGNLMEVSIVPFPALDDAEMTFIKRGPLPKTITDFEKALVADGYCRSRMDAQKLTLAVKNSLHLFHSGPPPGGESADDHPWLDEKTIPLLKAAADLTARFKAVVAR